MRRLALLAFVLVVLPPAGAADPKQIVLDPTYDHDKFVTKPMDIERKFRAFTVSFDSADDDDGDEVPDVWASRSGSPTRSNRRRLSPRRLTVLRSG